MSVSIPSFAKARVLVVGDIVLDRYWHGDTARISPEAPVPVVRVAREERRPGGAANVAVNLAAVGVQTRLLGAVGDDEAGAAVRLLLDQAGVAAGLETGRQRPTVSKLRVISRSQQLMRLDFERSFEPKAALDGRALLARYRAALADTDVVVCSDYGKGTLAGIEQALIAAARERDVPVLVDPKGHDWQRYANATIVTPNRREFEGVVGAAGSDAQLAARAHALRRRLALDALLITRGDRGMSLFSTRPDRHLAAQARQVFDVTGAGDTVIALLAAGIGAGLDTPTAAAIANLGAGVVVAKLGTATASPVELEHAARHGTTTAGMVDEPTLIARVEQARAAGQRVVMTNGCFDLVHPGHIAYLEAARALGQRLIVAVNDDASVARLKGAGRPLNDLAHRMQVLRGLRAVDWVVSFGEDTPERLICALAPDVLVKGGDYRVQDVAGGDCVRAAGGEVRVLDFVAGYSTREIIARMTDRD